MSEITRNKGQSSELENKLQAAVKDVLEETRTIGEAAVIYGLSYLSIHRKIQIEKFANGDPEKISRLEQAVQAIIINSQNTLEILAELGDNYKSFVIQEVGYKNEDRPKLRAFHDREEHLIIEFDWTSQPSTSKQEFTKFETSITKIFTDEEVKSILHWAIMSCEIDCFCITCFNKRMLETAVEYAQVKEILIPTLWKTNGKADLEWLEYCKLQHDDFISDLPYDSVCRNEQHLIREFDLTSQPSTSKQEFTKFETSITKIFTDEEMESILHWAIMSCEIDCFCITCFNKRMLETAVEYAQVKEILIPTLWKTNGKADLEWLEYCKLQHDDFISDLPYDSVCRNEQHLIKEFDLTSQPSTSKQEFTKFETSITKIFTDEEVESILHWAIMSCEMDCFCITCFNKRMLEAAVEYAQVKEILIPTLWKTNGKADLEWLEYCKLQHDDFISVLPYDSVCRNEQHLIKEFDLISQPSTSKQEFTKFETSITKIFTDEEVEFILHWAIMSCEMDCFCKTCFNKRMLEAAVEYAQVKEILIPTLWKTNGKADLEWLEYCKLQHDDFISILPYDSVCRN